MPLLLETTFTPTPDDEKLIEHVLSPHFPWYYQITTSPKYMGFLHTLLNRGEERKPVPGIVNSPYYVYFEALFRRICSENGVEVNTIFRAALNNNRHFPDQYGDIHVDHQFPHKNFLLYLTDFSNGSTYLFNDNDEVVQEIKAGKNKVVFFEGDKHATGFCAPYENRLVLVFTFI